MSDNRYPKVTIDNRTLDRVIEMALDGKHIKEILETIGLSHHKFWLYRKQNLSFADKFDQARQEAIERYTDDLLNIHEKEPDVQRARLISDNIKWIASKRKPTIYGDRIDVNVNQTVDISGALKEARQRKAIVGTQSEHNEDEDIIDVEHTESDIFD